MKENSKNWLIVILVVIIGILLVVNGVLFYLKNRNSSNIENDTGIKEEVKEEDKEVIKEEEKEITDLAIKQDLSKKVTYLSNSMITIRVDDGSVSYGIGEELDDFQAPQVFNYHTYENNLSEEEKLKVAIESLTNKFSDLPNNISNLSGEMKKYIETYGKEEYKQISAVSVSQAYKEYFGKELSKHQTVNSCPSYMYDSGSKMYYYSCVCGGTNPVTTYLYKSKYTVLNNNAYVYVSVATIDKDTNHLYQGLYKDSEAQANKVLTDSEVNNFKINNSNYQEFKIYRFVFKEGNNKNYYFDKAEEYN